MKNSKNAKIARNAKMEDLQRQNFPKYPNKKII